MSFSLFLRIFLISTCCITWVCIFFSTPDLVFAMPNNQTLFRQALVASEDGDFSSALLFWNQLLELSPENAAALSNRGNVRLALGDPQGAIADQNEAMKIMPDEVDPHLNRGVAQEALQHLGDHEGGEIL